MVNTDELLGGDYLNEKTCREGDLVEITGEGEFGEIKQADGRIKKLLNLPVLLNGQKKLTYSPGKKGLVVLNKAWGADSKNWTGKKFQVKFVLMQVGDNEKNVIKPCPIDVALQK